MTIDHNDLINSIMSSLDRIDYIKADELPNIGLYMDQVTSFLEERLKNSTRNPGEDKVLTKTMINNYAKNKLIPPPDKKKYDKEHMYLLIVIYYFKNILSINDIDTILKPVREKYLRGENIEYTLEDIYEGIRKTAELQTDTIKKDLMEKYDIAGSIFKDAEGEDREVLTNLSFIILLGLDVYIKKLLIEKLVDCLDETYDNRDKSK